MKKKIMKKKIDTYLSRESLGYDLYQYGYDTITIVVYQKDVPNISFWDELPQYLTTAKMYENKEGASYVKGYLDSLNVFISHSMLKIYGSLSKYCHKNNLKTLLLSEVRETLLNIGETLCFPLQQAIINRLDIAANIRVESSVSSYLLLFLKCKKFKKYIYEKEGTGFKNDKKELVFYDKNKEIKRKSINHLLRYELRLKRLGKIFKTPIKATEIYDPVFWNQMLDLWYNSYLDIEKCSKGKCDFYQVTGLKDLYDIALMQCCNNTPTIYDQLKIAEENGTLNKNTGKSIRKKLKNINSSLCPQDKNELIEELDNKMKAVVTQFRQ